MPNRLYLKGLTIACILTFCHVCMASLPRTKHLPWPVLACMAYVAFDSIDLVGPCTVFADCLRSVLHSHDCLKTNVSSGLSKSLACLAGKVHHCDEYLLNLCSGFAGAHQAAGWAHCPVDGTRGSTTSLSRHVLPGKRSALCVLSCLTAFPSSLSSFSPFSACFPFPFCFTVS